MSFKEWLVVIVLASTGTFLGMVFTVVSPSLPLIAQQFGGGAEGAFVAQWILTAPSIGVIIGGPTTGWFVERFGARKVLFISFVIFAIAGAGAIYIDDQSLLLLSRLIVGLSAVGQVTAAMTIIGELFIDTKRGAAIGLQNAIATGLSVVATLTAGVVAEHYGWRATFTLYAVSVPILILGALVIPISKRSDVGKAERRSASLLPLLPLYALVTVSMVINFLTPSEVPLLLAHDGFANPGMISRVLGAGTTFFALGAFGYGVIRARLGTYWTFMLALAFQGAGVTWLSMAHGLWGIALGGVILNLGSGIQTPNLSHWVLDRAPVAIRGRAVGLLFSAQFLGPFLNSAIVAPAIREYGVRNILMLIGALIAIAFLVTALRTRSSHVVREQH